MRNFILISLMLLLVNCAGKIEANIPKSSNTTTKEESLKIDVFSLTYHKQLGSCDSLPIRHRLLMFSYIPLTPNGSDYFAGNLEILLNEATGTYEALYKEYPGTGNADQTVFQTSLSGSFEVVKATGSATNDKMILQNIGVVTPAISGNKISFILAFDGDINKVMLQSEVLGATFFKGTSMVTDNCLL